MSKQNSNTVDARLLSACAPPGTSANCILDAVRYHIEAGGSRVRAHFCLDASRSLGIDPRDGLTLAAICELLHNASLIQDDLMDRTPMRRNQRSVWSVFGDATAICAGDLLLAAAFGLVGELTRPEFSRPVLALVTRRTRDVVLGQNAEQSLVANSLDHYELIAAGKSASLLSLPLELPLLLSGHSSWLERAQEATNAFAVAYQMIDDMADFEEDQRNGSPNAVAVALAMGSPDYASACSIIRSRADQLMQYAQETARQLPMHCAAAMIAYSDRAGATLSSQDTQTTKAREEMAHGA
jgi:geranylgeranyl pyrophosphate synthase